MKQEHNKHVTQQKSRHMKQVEGDGKMQMRALESGKHTTLELSKMH